MVPDDFFMMFHGNTIQKIRDIEIKANNYNWEKGYNDMYEISLQTLVKMESDANPELGTSVRLMGLK